jgi:hypothetical protein
MSRRPEAVLPVNRSSLLLPGSKQIAIRAYIEMHPTSTSRDVATELGVNLAVVLLVRRKMRAQSATVAAAPQRPAT